MMYHVILCGGVGSRFWPMSTKGIPKQFIKFINDKSLLRLTIDRLLEISDPSKIILVTSDKYKELISEDLPEIPNENILCEPSPMNTTAAIYFASKFIALHDSNASIGVYPADHYIKNVKKFTDNIIHIEKCIEENSEGIFTLGINPNYSSTSYGYIECKDEGVNNIYKVSSFKEKPSLKIAKDLINNKKYVWNSGMFFFNVSAMINEIERYVPEIKNLYKSIDYDQDNLPDKVCDIWDRMPKKSIDYTVMEKSNNIYCMKSELGWSDLGTWVSLYELLNKDSNNNILQGDILTHDAKNNLIISDDHLVSVVGLDNVGVINHKGKILVINLDKSEEVRHIISQLDDKDK